MCREISFCFIGNMRRVQVFGWQYKWLYPLAAVLVGMFLRGMFSGVYVEIDKEKI